MLNKHHNVWSKHRASIEYGVISRPLIYYLPLMLSLDAHRPMCCCYLGILGVLNNNNN